MFWCPLTRGYLFLVPVHVLRVKRSGRGNDLTGHFVVGSKQVDCEIAVAIQRRLSNGLMLAFLGSSLASNRCGESAVAKHSLVKLLAVADEYLRTTRGDQSRVIFAMTLVPLR